MRTACDIERLRDLLTLRRDAFVIFDARAARCREDVIARRYAATLSLEPAATSIINHHQTRLPSTITANITHASDNTMRALTRRYAAQHGGACAMMRCYRRREQRC